MQLPFRLAPSICKCTNQFQNSKLITNKNKYYPKFSIGLSTLAIIFVCSVSNVSLSHADSLLTAIPVGNNPFGIAYDSANGEIYVANYAGNSVSAINEATNSLITTIPVTINPLGVAYDSANGNIYVTNVINGVYVINGATNTLVSTITVGNTPGALAYDPANGNIYVTNSVDNTVSVINGATNTVIATIAVGTGPYGVAVDSANGNVYVANQVDNNLSVINGATNTVLSKIPVGNNPVGVTYDAANGNIYVTNYLDNTVSVINATNTVVAKIQTDASPYGVTYDSANGNIYVANYASNDISIINATSNSQITAVPACTNPIWLAFDPTTHNIYASCYSDGSVAVIQDAPAVIPPSPIIIPGITPSTNPTDTTPPVISIPANIEAFPTGLLGASISYTVTATDPDDPSVTPTCTSASGAVFPIGTTHVTCYAQDAAGNQATPVSFTIKIYTPAQGAQHLEGEIQALDTAKPGTITSLDMMLHTKLSLIPGLNGYPKVNLANFIDEVNKKCCLQIDPVTGQRYIHEASDIVAATP